MTPEIVNGDYVKDGRSLKEIEHIEELLQSIALNLKAQRGCFYPDKNFGSHIFAAKDKACDYIAALARQAVFGIDGVYIKSAKVSGENYAFTVIINNLERQVLIKA